MPRIVEAVYYVLHRITGRCIDSERSGQTLTPTALVNEAFLRLKKSDGLAFEDRSHFLAVAPRSMRRILLNHAEIHG